MRSPEEVERLKALHEKYGIPYVERTQIYPAKDLPRPGEPWPPSRERGPEFMAMVEEIIEEHRDVLRALAKR